MLPTYERHESQIGTMRGRAYLSKKSVERFGILGVHVIDVDDLVVFTALVVIIRLTDPVLHFHADL
jgi:hypothetical protein